MKLILTIGTIMYSNQHILLMMMLTHITQFQMNVIIIVYFMNINILIKFMEETGGNVQDYARLNADYSNVDNNTLLREKRYKYWDK